MSGRILVCHAEGIGNCIQISPCLRTLKEVLGYELDYWHAFSSFKIPKLIPYVDKWFTGSEINAIDTKQYIGLVSTIWTKQYINKLPLRNLTKITQLSMSKSEVDTYMDIARGFGVEEDKIIWHGNCLFKSVESHYDVVIHNGYNSIGAANWKIKEYPSYTKVAKILRKNGVNVCSVGSKKEYLTHTDDMTGLSLLTSLGLVRNAKLFVGNDSGLYHCANALEVPNIVIFTATSILKNYDSRFHKFTTIIGRDDLKCRPCQAGKKWNQCKDWKCQQIDPSKVAHAIMEKLNG